MEISKYLPREMSGWIAYMSIAIVAVGAVRITWKFFNPPIPEAERLAECAKLQEILQKVYVERFDRLQADEGFQHPDLNQQELMLKNEMTKLGCEVE
ncbi:MAG: hypothetical protein AAGD25_06840 [Cyanobacteria bacterium P01_F01_bin.150]